MVFEAVKAKHTSTFTSYLEPSARFCTFLVFLSFLWKIVDRWYPIPVAAEEMGSVVILLLLPLAVSFKFFMPSTFHEQGEEAPVTKDLDEAARRTENVEHSQVERIIVEENVEHSQVTTQNGPQRIVTASWDGSVRLWGLDSGECELTLEDAGCAISSIAVSADNCTLATGGCDGFARVWDAETGVCKHIFDDGGGGVNSIALSPCGSFLLTGLDDNNAQLWCIPTSEMWHGQTGLTRSVPISVWADHTASVTSVAFSPCSSLAATASWDGTTRLWSVASGHCEHVLQGHDAEVFSVTFSPCGNMLATGSQDGSARIWNVTSGWCLAILEGHETAVRSVAFSPDSETVTTGCWDSKVSVWDVRTAECLRTFSARCGKERINSMALSADGSTIVTAHGHDAELWNAESGQCSKMLEGHTDAVQSVAIMS